MNFSMAAGQMQEFERFVLAPIFTACGGDSFHLSFFQMADSEKVRLLLFVSLAVASIVIQQRMIACYSCF